MSIKLKKESLVCLYCHARQAERSIDRTLMARWSSLLEYYDSERRAGIDGLLVRIGGIVPGIGTCRGRSDRPKRRLRDFALKWLNRRRKSWRFLDSEVTFARHVLSRFRMLLEAEQRPDQDHLIELRTDLYLLGWMIEERTGGLAEIQRARRVEHFPQPDHLEMLPLPLLASDTTD